MAAGSSPPGETARRLLEQRLDQIEQHQARDTAQQSLRDLRATWQGGPAGPPAAWHCLAAYTTQAYAQAIRHGRSVVDRTVLVAMMQGVEELGACRPPGSPLPQRAQDPDASRPPEQAGGLAAIPPTPTPEMGYGGCRQFADLVCEAPTLALTQGHAPLAPGRATLLQLALRGYWYTYGASILDTPEAAPPCFLLTGTSQAVGRCISLLAGHRLSVVLTLTTPPLEVALRTYVEWLDLLTLGRVRLAWGPEGFTGLAALLQAAGCSPICVPIWRSPRSCTDTSMRTEGARGTPHRAQGSHRPGGLHAARDTRPCGVYASPCGSVTPRRRGHMVGLRQVQALSS